MSSLEAQNKKLGQLLEPKFLVETITKAVANNLNMARQISLKAPPVDLSASLIWGDHAHHNWPQVWMVLLIHP